MTFYLLITHPPVYADVPSVRPSIRLLQISW